MARDGLLSLPTVRPASQHPFSTCGEGCGERELTGLCGITVDSLVSTSTLPFLPPILARKMAQPPSFHEFEATKQPLCQPTLPYTASVLSPSPDPQRKKQACLLPAGLREPGPQARSPFPDSMGTGRYHLAFQQASDTLVCIVAPGSLCKLAEPPFPIWEPEQ